MSLEKHKKDYKEKAWNKYSINELGNFIHLFHKRAGHRSNIDKITKDLYDAKNYLYMIEEKLKAECEKYEINYENLR